MRDQTVTREKILRSELTQVNTSQLTPTMLIFKSDSNDNLKQNHAKTAKARKYATSAERGKMCGRCGNGMGKCLQLMPNTEKCTGGTKASAGKCAAGTKRAKMYSRY